MAPHRAVWAYGSCATVTHMKTTIELPDSLLDEAREAAREGGTTLRELVEQGLREVLARRSRRERFRLRDASFTGQGMQPEFQDASWEEVLDAGYGVPPS